MSWLPVLPLLLPAATAVATLLSGRAPRLRRTLALAGSAALLAAAGALVAAVWRHGILAVQVGGWPAPFGITLAADHLSAALVLIAALVSLGGALYAADPRDAEREALGFHPLYHVLMFGVCGAFLTGDLFNLYVWFEVILIASFALLVLGNERGQLRGAAKYMVLNLIASFTLLAAVGLLYGVTGTLNMADLAVRLAEADSAGLVLGLSMLFLVSFGIKAAVFPLFFAVPAAYHTPPAVISAVFAGLLTKVAMYAVFRVFTLLFTQAVGFTHSVVLLVAGFTMAVGVLGALAQEEIRRILSFQIVSGMGYMAMGLGLFTPLALAGGIFYMFHDILVKANLFFVGGLVERHGGAGRLARLGGLYRSRPFLATLFLIPAFSLAGFPPLSGFWAKLILIKAGLDAGAWLIVGVALAVGLLTLFSMMRIWLGAFWKPEADERVAADETVAGGERAGAAAAGAAFGGSTAPIGRMAAAPAVGLAALTLLIGLWAQPLLDYSERAAGELLDPSRYVAAVLEARP